MDPLIAIVSGLAAAALSLATAAHIILTKRDVRAAIGWTATALFVPVIGPLLYVLLGVNRIKRKAHRLRAEVSRTRATLTSSSVPSGLAAALGTRTHILALERLVDGVTAEPLCEGNVVTALIDGDATYPAMIDAIDSATTHVELVTYIFDNDPAGRRVAAALIRARERGVTVRVLIDAAGVHYSDPPIDGVLLERGVRAERFMPAFSARFSPYFNLRNHRKILIVDGRIGFTGGMNIRGSCVLLEAPQDPTHDVHFLLRGPVLRHLHDAFAEDWLFTTGETLEMTTPPPVQGGRTFARGIPDGPDEDMDKMRWTFLGALACARSNVRIVTPYFLPDAAVTTALDVAAMRGVEVDIVLPSQGNLRIVEWAMWGQLRQVLRRGCRVWLTPLPFDHSKLFVVDDVWSLIGSANWDPRSLRLNFEFGVECYDPVLAAEITGIIEKKRSSARQIFIGDVENRPISLRLRDGLARLMSPYL